MSVRAVRLGGVAAIVFVVLVLISGFSASQPQADDSVAKIRSYMVDHRTAILMGTFLTLLAIPFAVWFVVVLREVLRGDRTTDTLGTAIVVGWVLTGSSALAGAAVGASAVYVKGVAASLGDDSLRIVFEAQQLLFAATSAGTVVFAAAAAWAIRRTGALPAFTMWLALLAAVGNVVGLLGALGAGASGFGFLGFVTMALFVLVTGITMAAGKAKPLDTAPRTA